MRAIVLSAGRGERLKPLTDTLPKSLIEIQPGLPLVEAQMRSIAEAGNFSEVVFVTGYRASQLEDYLSHCAYVPVSTVFNPFFDISNNLISLWLAIHKMDEPFVVINGDDLFSPKLLTDLHTESRDISMVISRKDHYDVDDMKVVIEGDHILKVGKNINLSEAQGESIGMIKFAGLGIDMLKAKLNWLVRNPENRNVFWLEAIQQLIDSNVEVNYVECSPREWAEMDFHVDLSHVRNRLTNIEQTWHAWRSELGRVVPNDKPIIPG